MDKAVQPAALEAAKAVATAVARWAEEEGLLVVAERELALWEVEETVTVAPVVAVSGVVSMAEEGWELAEMAAVVAAAAGWVVVEMAVEVAVVKALATVGAKVAVERSAEATAGAAA